MTLTVVQEIAMRVILLSLFVASSIACSSTPAPLPQAPAPATGGRCGKDFGSSPFQKKDATHILVADFFASRASEPDFADTVSHQVDGELKRYRDELRDPRKMDVEVPEGSLEIQRLRCFVEDHDQARAIAEALGADLVVWGKAFCNATSPVTAQVALTDQSTTVVQPGQITADHGGVNNVGTHTMKVEVQAGKPYTVCPSATLYQRERDFRRDAEPGMSLGSIGDLDLPTLRSSEPFQLVHFTLGLHFYEMNMFPLAARFFKQSADKVLAGERNAEALELMLGRAYYDLPDLKQSIEYSKSALGRVRGTDTAIETRLESNIGRALRAQGDYKGALEYYGRALAIGEKVYGPEHPAVAALEDNIGRVLQDEGDLKGALEHLHRALAIDEKVLGPNHPDIAAVENDIGNVLHEQGDDKGGLEHYHRALAIGEKVYGPDHPAFLEKIISDVLQEEGNLKGALEHLRLALAIDQKVYGPNHPKVAVSENDIGSVLQDQGDYTGALAHYRRALAIDEKAYGPDHPKVAVRENNIGTVLRDQGDLKGALEHSRRALAINEKVYGPDHPKVAVLENNISGVLYRQDDPKGALEHAHRALAIFEKWLGPEHPTTIELRMSIAAIVAEQSGWKQDGKHPGTIMVRCVQQDCHGLQPGDWLVSYGTTAIRDAKHLVELVTSTPPNRPMTLTVVRDHKKIRLPARGSRLGIELL